MKIKYIKNKIREYGIINIIKILFSRLITILKKYNFSIIYFNYLQNKKNYLPSIATRLYILIATRLRLLDDTMSNRILPYRNKIIFNEIVENTEEYFDFSEDYTFLNLGSGERNSLGLNFLFALFGAKKSYSLEPGDINKESLLFGLQEVFLDLFRKPTEYKNIIYNKNFSFVLTEAVCIDKLMKFDERCIEDKNLILLNKAAENMPLEDESIDFIYSRSVLEHILNFKVVFEEMLRVLSSTGIMYHDIDLTAHNKYDSFNFYNHNIVNDNKKFHGLNGLRINDYIHYFEASGCEVIVVDKTINNDYSIDRNKITEHFAAYSEQELKTSRVKLIIRKQ